MIVVGIPNTDRNRDSSPTPLAIDDPSVSYLKTTGGGDKIIAFLEKELMPYIDAGYPTETYKILIGHSLGVLTVMQTFVHRANLFNSYICIDPSMWWDNQTLLKESAKVLKDKKFHGVSFFSWHCSCNGRRYDYR